jgi:hypothetical protein
MVTGGISNLARAAGSKNADDAELLTGKRRKESLLIQIEPPIHQLGFFLFFLVRR